LIAVDDRSRRSISEKLLERRRVLERIRRAVPEPRLCHLAPYNSTVFERDLALALDIPTYAADPHHADFGSGSGCRELFAQAGVPCPAGAAHINSIAEAIRAIIRLWRVKPDVTQLVMKLNQGVSGEGNAIVDLDGLPESVRSHAASQKCSRSKGVIGRLAVDFVVARRDDGRWEPFAIEINLRKGGTTHPYEALGRLAGGAHGDLVPHAELARRARTRWFHGRRQQLRGGGGAV
jgi:hypothetical protein